MKAVSGVLAALWMGAMVWCAFAQEAQPVTAALTIVPADGVKPGQDVELRITLNIPPPWHVYGSTPGPEGQQPLEIDLKLPADVEPLGQWAWPPHERVFAGHEVHVYNAGAHVFRRRIRIGDAVTLPLRLTGSLTFQACTPEFCAPVETIELSAVISAG